MATFQIHQDEENNVPKFCKTKETQQQAGGQKRSVLGTINLNHETKNYRITNDNIFIKKDTTITVTDCQDKVIEKEDVKTVHTPLKEITNKDNNEGNDKVEVKRPSPMSVDATPKPDENLIVSCRNNIFSELIDPAYVCPPYNQDIYNYLKTMETKYKAKPYYMKRQPDVTYAMRTILVDWLVEVGEEYRLHNETLFMAVALIDRFLSSMAVVRTKLQLLGTSAMFLASKYEEIYPPEANEFTYITDDTYTKKQLLRMEQLVLNVLSFNLSAPTVYTFITHISAINKLPETVTYLAMYLAELSLLEGDPYIEYTPSAIACASLILSNHCLDCNDIWSQPLIKMTGYSLTVLSPLIQHLSDTHAKSFTSQQQASRDKYSRPKYHRASLIPPKRLIVRDPLPSS